jgi:hypothetical protein
LKVGQLESLLRRITNRNYVIDFEPDAAAALHAPKVIAP